MYAKPRIGRVLLVLALVMASGCALILRRGADEIRQQQNESQPGANGADTKALRKKKPHAKATREVVRTAGKDLSAGLVEGAFEELDKPERKEQIASVREGITDFVGKVPAEIIDGVREQLPTLQPAIVDLVNGVRDELGLDPVGTARKVTRAALEEARSGIHELRPEIHALVEKDLIGPFKSALDDVDGEKLAQTVRTHVKPALQELTSDTPDLAEKLGKKAASGLSQGLAQELEKTESGTLGGELERIAARLDESAEKATGNAGQVVGNALSDAALFGFIALAAILIVALAVAFIRYAGQRVKAEQAERARASTDELRQVNEEMLRLVTKAIHDAGQRDSLDVFRNAIKRIAAQENKQGVRADLDRFLDQTNVRLPKSAQTGLTQPPPA